MKSLLNFGFIAIMLSLGQLRVVEVLDTFFVFTRKVFIRYVAFCYFSFTEDYRDSYSRPRSAGHSLKEQQDKKKNKHTFGPQTTRPAFSTSTGEQIHSAWDLDDELL